MRVSEKRLPVVGARGGNENAAHTGIALGVLPSRGHREHRRDGRAEYLAPSLGAWRVVGTSDSGRLARKTLRGGIVATRTDFTEQEWETLQKGVTGARLLVSLSDRGFFDTFKEAGSLAKQMAQAKQSSSSGLVRELADMHARGSG
jgi:hypothetical protein